MKDIGLLCQPVPVRRMEDAGDRMILLIVGTWHDRGFVTP